MKKLATKLSFKNSKLTIITKLFITILLVGSYNLSYAVCGDGFADPGEQCDLGTTLNADPLYGCTTTCQAKAGYVCANGPVNRLEAWKTEFDSFIETYKDCINSPDSPPVLPALCNSGISQTALDRFIYDRQYIIGVSDRCNSTNATGDHQKITLHGRGYYFRCTQTPFTVNYDRQYPTIMPEPRDYNVSYDTACDTATSDVIDTADVIAIPKGTTNCRALCDNNFAVATPLLPCVAAEEINGACTLYSSCTAGTTGATSGTTLWLAQ